MTISNDKVFILNTKNLSYVFHVDESGLLLHDYFGNKIDIVDFDISAIKQKISCQKGTSVIYDKEKNPNLSMDYTLLEFSFPNKGDYRDTPILLRNDEAGYTFDFSYEKYEIRKNPKAEGDMPTPHDGDEELVIYLKDKAEQVRIELHYLIFEESDVIARNVVINNLGPSALHVLKALSFNLDLINRNFELVSFTGGWASEMNEGRQTLVPGIYQHQSMTGFSSHKVNPLFLLKEKDASLDNGDVYIFNLVYSGNHLEEVELTPYGYVRVQAGINPFCFDHLLYNDQSFKSPYAVFTFSSKGINGARSNMHHFVNEHIIASRWKEELRPVIINNWEGTYFKFTESKVLKIAKAAKKFGAELFVLDDGWFSNRNNDSAGLGDYDVNPKKLPHGLDGLAKKVNKMGMKFGLWFEPESINADSKLYKLHPEWVIRNEKSEPCECRNQFLLDLTKKEVRDYIVDHVHETLLSANIEYVKWDMNRHMSDLPGGLTAGEFFHNYILGLYDILNRLTTLHPNVLFEGCASGGNRFDLGILSYCPQIWASDDTDAYERLRIQHGYLYGYPLSVLSNHISESPSQQALRSNTIDTRFNVACFGVLGYELIFTELTKFEKQRMKELIKIYKNNRRLLQFGDFRELSSNNGHWKYQVISDDKINAIVAEYAVAQSITPQESILTTVGLLDDVTYKVDNVPVPHNIHEFGGLVNQVLPFHLNPNGKLVDLVSKHMTMPSEKDNYIVKGNVLNNKGIILTPEWSASGFNEYVRVLRDYGSRLYVISEIVNEK